MIFRKKKKEDSTLIKAIYSSGKPAQIAENQLFKKYTGLVINGQRKHRLNKEEALDAYSETMLVVFKHIRENKFKGKSSLKTYILRIFNNKCIDLIRKKTTNKSSVHYRTEDLTSIANQQAHQNIQKHLENVELLENLKRKLDVLGQTCKQIILEYAYGFSYQEIAVRLNPPFKNGQTVKSKKSQCLKKLYRALEA